MLLASCNDHLIIQQFKSSFLGTCLLETSHIASDVGNYKLPSKISTFGIRPDFRATVANILARNKLKTRNLLRINFLPFHISMRRFTVIMIFARVERKVVVMQKDY